MMGIAKQEKEILTMDHRWTFGAIGDVYVNRANPDDAFEYSNEVLRSVDLLFGNCEGAYTDHPSTAPGAGWVVCSTLANLKALENPGFDVMACANNHIIDGGYDGLDHTLTGLRGIGIQAIGAGQNALEARKPALVQKGNVKVGFLARSSVHPPAYGASAKTPGLAAIRILTNYYVRDGDAYSHVEPGSPPVVWTTPRMEDLVLLEDDIGQLKETSDVVIASFHWGTARDPVVLMDYERELARKAIDFGADIVLGHHHHFLRGVEFYRGKPIFYGLGHFVFDMDTDTMWSADEVKRLEGMGEYAIYPREGYPMLPFHPDGRMTMMAVFSFEGNQLDKVGIVPCLISPHNHAIPLKLDSSDGKMVLDYLREISAKVGISTKYSSDDAFPIGSWLAAEVRA